MTNNNDSADKYLVRADEIATFAGVSKQHFLNPNGKRLNKSLGDMTGLTGIGFHLVEVEPGYQSTEYHFHHLEDECLYILAGKGLVTIGDEQHEVSEGDFIGFRKGGLAHQLENTGDTILRYLMVGERRENDVCEYPLKRKRLYNNPGTGLELIAMEAIEKPQGVGKK